MVTFEVKRLVVPSVKECGGMKDERGKALRSSITSYTLYTQNDSESSAAGNEQSQ